MSRRSAAPFAALALPGLAHALELSVDLLTDFAPHDEVAAVRTTVIRTDGTEADQQLTIPVVRATPLGTGVRAGDFDGLTSGAYDVQVELLGGDGDAFALRVFPLNLRQSSFSMNTAILRDEIVALKTWQLLHDVDEDGHVSAGDVLRYTVWVSPVAGGDTAVHDVPGVGSRLLTGTVTTTHGVVTEGNAGGDAEVHVELGGVLAGDTATVTFDVLLQPVVHNQASVWVTRSSIQSPGWLTTLQRTDDPATTEPTDPTVTVISAAGYAQCRDDLATCTDEAEGLHAELDATLGELDVCARELQECQVTAAETAAELAALLDDPDHDGVPAIADDCPGSAGAPVDRHGCTQAQFCRAIDLTTWRGNAACRLADWTGDGPNDVDCAVLGTSCAARRPPPSP